MNEQRANQGSNPEDPKMDLDKIRNALQLVKGQQLNKQLAESAADRFAILFDELPEDLIERRIIGRILSESRIKIARMLIEIDNEPAAIEQLNTSLELLDQLMETYPGVERLATTREECHALLDELDASG